VEKNKGYTEQAHTFRTQAISYLKQALDIVKTHFLKDSPHIVRIEMKLKKIESEAL
jgi:hypothetical protein